MKEWLQEYTEISPDSQNKGEKSVLADRKIGE
jgi:hypothetical protein